MTTIGLLLALCVWGTFGQTTQSEFNCYLDNVIDLASQNPGCRTALANAFQPGTNLTDAQIQPFCTGGCASVVNDFLMSRCNSALIVGLCSVDDMGYCVPRSGAIGELIGQTIAGPCLSVNCTDPTCNAAVANLTCCVDAITTITDFVGIGSFLPSDCSVMACNTTITGGAEMVVSMPLAILISLMLSAYVVLA